MGCGWDRDTKTVFFTRAGERLEGGYGADKVKMEGPGKGYYPAVSTGKGAVVLGNFGGEEFVCPEMEVLRLSQIAKWDSHLAAKAAQEAFEAGGGVGGDGGGEGGEGGAPPLVDLLVSGVGGEGCGGGWSPVQQGTWLSVRRSCWVYRGGHQCMRKRGRRVCRR